MTPRALLLAAAAVGFAVSDAAALTPLALDAAIEPQISEGPSPHARLAPRAFERRPDAEYEPTAILADRRAGLQCVPFARREANLEIFGDANTWWGQAKDRYQRARAPAEGAVLVLRGYEDANRGHVAVVREIVSDRLIVVDHANWLNGGEVTRNVPVRDVSEAGDWSRVQVWHVPTQQWGGRAYRVQGFILNLVDRVRAQARQA